MDIISTTEELGLGGQGGRSFLECNEAMECADLFSAKEVEAIQSIPRSVRDVEDMRIWHYERNGKFSVWSAYQVAHGIIESHGNEADGSSSSSSGVGEQFWKKL